MPSGGRNEKPPSLRRGAFRVCGASVDVDELRAEVLGGDVGVVVALALFGDFADVERLGGAVLDAAQAADAVAAEDGTAALEAYVVPGTHRDAGAAADALVVYGVLRGLLSHDLGEAGALKDAGRAP